MPADRFPELVSPAHEDAHADRGERFGVLADIFEDGLARLAAAG